MENELDIVLGLVRHLANPCSNPLRKEDGTLAQMHANLAEANLQEIKNPYLKSLLAKSISEAQQGKI